MLESGGRMMDATDAQFDAEDSLAIIHSSELRILDVAVPTCSGSNSLPSSPPSSFPSPKNDLEAPSDDDDNCSRDVKGEIAADWILAILSVIRGSNAVATRRRHSPLQAAATAAAATTPPPPCESDAETTPEFASSSAIMVVTSKPSQGEVPCTSARCRNLTKSGPSEPARCLLFPTVASVASESPYKSRNERKTAGRTVQIVGRAATAKEPIPISESSADATLIESPPRAATRQESFRNPD